MIIQEFKNRQNIYFENIKYGIASHQIKSEE